MVTIFAGGLLLPHWRQCLASMADRNVCEGSPRDSLLAPEHLRFFATGLNRSSVMYGTRGKAGQSK